MSNFLTKYQAIIIVSALVILIRFMLIFTPSFEMDMNTWKAWASRLVEVSPINFYSPDYFSDYLPGYLYILWIIGVIYKIIFFNSSFNSQNFEFLLKFITTLFDLLTAWYIFKIVSTKNNSWASFTSLVYILNPAVIFNSSIWGQVDGVVTFFMVFSTYSLLILEKPAHWSLAMAIAFITKPQSLAIFPVMLIYLLKNTAARKLYIRLSFFILLILIISLPFFLENPFFGLLSALQNATAQYPYTSVYAINFWSLIGWWIPDNQLFLSTPYQLWGYILFLISLILILYPLIKTNRKILYFFAMALLIFSFFLFLTRIHERYLFPLFAFLIITTGLMKSKSLLLIYIAISVIHLINLWYVYYYYNVIYNNQNFLGNLFFDFIANIIPLLSLTSIGIFVILLAKYFKIISSKNL